MSTTSKRAGSSLKRRRRIPVRCPPREPRPHVYYPHIVPKVVSNHKKTQNQKQIEQLRMRVAVLKYIIRYREQEERLQNSQSSSSTSHKRSRPSSDRTPRPGPHKVPKRGVAHTPNTAGLHTPRHGVGVAYPPHTPVGTPGGTGLHTPRGVNGGVGLVGGPSRMPYRLNYDPDYPPSPLIRKFAKVVVSLMNEPTAPPFNQPVDHRALHLPRYPEIVKRPMDLGTIKRNVEEGKYGTVEELKRDVDQVWINCKLFNGPLLPITKSAVALQEKWEKAFAAIARESGLRIPAAAGAATPRGVVGANHHPTPRGANHAPGLTNGVTSTPRAGGPHPIGAKKAVPTPGGGPVGAAGPHGAAPSTLASPLDADERWLRLGANDMDPVTGRVVELNLMQVEKLSEEMLKLNAADVMTAVKILKQDPNYAPPLNGKLQFTPARYSKETQRKLQNYFNHLSMTGKTKKRAITPARVTTQRGGLTPGGSLPRSTGAMLNGGSMSASSRGPPPVATRLGGLTPRGPGGLTPGGVGGGSTPRPGGPTSLLKGDDDDEDSSSDDSDDDDDESDTDSSDDDNAMKTSQSPTTGGANFKKRVKWNFANKVKKDAEARKRKAEEAARLATSAGGSTPNTVRHRPPGSLTPGAVPRGSSGLPSSSMTPTAASGGRPGWPQGGGFNRMNSPMGPPGANRALSSPFPNPVARPGQSPMHPGMRHHHQGGVPPPPTPAGTVRTGHVPPPPPQRGAPSRPGINVSQQATMMARMQSQYGA